MAFTVKDRVKETTTTDSTGTVTLLGASSGFQAFSAVGDGNTTYYAIVHQSQEEWEVGIGTYTLSGTTLSRDTIISSTNGGSAVNFSSGTKDVFVTYPAEKAVYTSASPAFVSATFSDHVSASTLAVTGITSIGGSLVGTSATFSDHVSASTLAVTGITSIGGSLVGTSATFSDHVSVSSMTVTGNVTATEYYGSGSNLTGVGGGLFKGNNGQTGSSAGDIFRINVAELSVSTSINSDENASATGPLSVLSGATLTVSGTLVII